MGDLICEQCSEPWTYHYLCHEMPEDEKGKILQGKGCPACDWGESERASGQYRLERIQSIEQNTDLDPVRYI